MKTKIFTLLLAVAASVGTMFAWDYEGVKIGDLYYNLDATNKTAEVTSQNSDYPYWSIGITKASIPTSVTYNGIIYSVTSIGEVAFCGCRNLTSVTIPNSVTYIGDNAFAGCTSLTSVTIPNSVTNIGYAAFMWCNITSVTIPNSVTSIGDNAFARCNDLTSINVAKDNPNYCSIDGVLFDKEQTELIQYPLGNIHTEYNIPNSVKSIGGSAFHDCTNLTSVTIPNSVENIEYHAFADCSGLTSISIGNNVKKIEYNAFQSCTNLTSVTIPNSVTYIGDNAFAWCSGLTSLIIPNSVTYIGDNAFAGIANIVYSGSATGSPWGAYNVGFTEGYLAYLDSTKTELIACSPSVQGEIIIPNSVTRIKKYAFSGCTCLTSVTIPNSVTYIGDNAFAGCTSLTSVTLNSNKIAKDFSLKNILGAQVTEYIIGEDVTSIGGGAFEDCTNLTSVNIPNSVTYIGSDAFAFCYGLASLTIPNSVTYIGDDAFYGVANIVYSGSATGSPWGAKSINGFVDGYFVFSDKTRTNLLACSSTANGEIAIPNSVQSISWGAFQGCTCLTSVTIPNSVSYIGDYAFIDVANIVYSGSATGAPWGAGSINGYLDDYLVYRDSTKTTLLACSSAAKGKITIPNSVTSIGESAFYGCSGLTSVDIPDGVTSIGESTFCGCSSLISVTIPNSVTSIGENAFGGCSGLTSVTIPNSVTSIGENAFSGCCSLKYVTINSDDIAWGIEYSKSYNLKYIFGNQVETYIIGDEVDAIGNYAFYGCSGLKSVKSIDTLGISYIGDYAFYGCSSLQSVSYHDVSYIGLYAFFECSSLHSITIPYSVIYIREHAFEGCKSLTSVIWNAENCPTFEEDGYVYPPFYTIREGITSFTIGNNVKVIPSYLCYGMSNITRLNIPNSVTSIGESAFYECSGLTSVEIPDGVKTIENWTFTGSSLTSVAMPNTISSVGYAAFARCKGLTSMNIPNSVTCLGKYAFINCQNLDTLYLGENITTYGDSVFEGCTKLSAIYNYRERPAKLGSGAFDGVDYFNCTLYVLAGSVDMYKSTGSDWKDFYFVESIGANTTSLTANGVSVVPAETTALFTWPADNSASTYTLQITKDGVVFCTLVFNGNGQLTGIAFAPGRNGATHAPAATTSVAGMSFTVTGLDGASKYAYRLAVKDAEQNEVQRYSGEFATTGYIGEVNTGGEPEINTEGTEEICIDGQKTTKILRNSQIYILRGDKTYTLTGAEVK